MFRLCPHSAHTPFSMPALLTQDPSKCVRPAFCVLCPTVSALCLNCVTQLRWPSYIGGGVLPPGMGMQRPGFNTHVSTTANAVHIPGMQNDLAQPLRVAGQVGSCFLQLISHSGGTICNQVFAKSFIKYSGDHRPGKGLGSGVAVLCLCCACGCAIVLLCYVMPCLCCDALLCFYAVLSCYVLCGGNVLLSCVAVSLQLCMGALESCFRIPQACS